MFIVKQAFATGNRRFPVGEPITTDDCPNVEYFNRMSELGYIGKAIESAEAPAVSAASADGAEHY